MRKRGIRIKKRDEFKSNSLNKNIEKMIPDKRAFLDSFDEILDKNRSSDEKELYKQISYLDVKHLFNCFTI